MHHPSWNSFFENEKQKSLWSSWMAFLDDEYAQHTVFPSRDQIFRAFAITPLSEIKIVILGQDPYHQPLQAHGLSFSVPKGVPLPRSLRNVYKEIENDLQVTMDYQSGDLTYLAQQGVLLLNTILTVREASPLSHIHPFYESFFESVMRTLNQEKQKIVFMLWGHKAHRYVPWIDASKHLIIQTNHPSPLSANRGGWFHTKPFSRANTFLMQHQRTTVNWVNH
jgi:uracil-DNA glycosylase